MSGEQAEERTAREHMTKHADSSRSTNSGVSGNAQTGAREIRLRAEKIATEIFEKVFGAPAVKARNGDDADAAESASVLTKVIRHMYIEQMSDILECELAECSRLATRVEELENLIAKHSGCSHGADSASEG